MSAGLLRPAVGLEDAICRMLLAEAEMIWRRGLARQYVERREPCRFLRGRVLWTENFPWRGARARETVCRYHEMSFDNLDNRLVLAGLRSAACLAKQKETVQRTFELLRMWEEFATSVPVGDTDFETARGSHTRLTEHYRTAHVLSRMLVTGLRPATPFEEGGHKTPAFIIDMTELFERFCERYVKDILGGTELSVVAQSRDRWALLDAEGRTYSSVRPDLEIRDRAGKTVAVIDAKYKPYWRSSQPDGRPARKVTNADLYQLLFYQKRLQLRDRLPQPPVAVLLSPLPSEDERPPELTRDLAPRYRRVTCGGDPTSSVSVCFVPVTEMLRKLAGGEAPREAVEQFVATRLLRKLLGVETEGASAEADSVAREVGVGS